MQPSNMQAFVPGVARHWINKGQYYYANMEAGNTARHEKTTVYITQDGLVACACFHV